MCPLNLDRNDPAARWLKQRILSYVRSEEFVPSVRLTEAELGNICSADRAFGDADSNRAINKNDITA